MRARAERVCVLNLCNCHGAQATNLELFATGEYYDLYHTPAPAHAKLYWQKKTVADRPNPPQGKDSARHDRQGEGYADYRVGFW